MDVLNADMQFHLEKHGKKQKQNNVCLFSQFADVDVHWSSFLLGLKEQKAAPA